MARPGMGPLVDMTLKLVDCLFHGPAGPGMAWQRVAWHGPTGRGLVWQCMGLLVDRTLKLVDQFSTAWRGKAGYDTAGRGEARRGEATHGSVSRHDTETSRLFFCDEQSKATCIGAHRETLSDIASNKGHGYRWPI